MTSEEKASGGNGTKNRVFSDSDSESVATEVSGGSVRERALSFAADYRRMKELEAGLRGTPMTERDRVSSERALQNLYRSVEQKGNSLKEECKKNGRVRDFLAWVEKGAVDENVPDLSIGAKRTRKIRQAGEDGKKRRPEPNRARTSHTDSSRRDALERWNIDQLEEQYRKLLLEMREIQSSDVRGDWGGDEARRRIAMDSIARRLEEIGPELERRLRKRGLGWSDYRGWLDGIDREDEEAYPGLKTDGPFVPDVSRSDSEEEKDFADTFEGVTPVFDVEEAVGTNGFQIVTEGDLRRPDSEYVETGLSDVSGGAGEKMSESHIGASVKSVEGAGTGISPNPVGTAETVRLAEEAVAKADALGLDESTHVEKKAAEDASRNVPTVPDADSSVRAGLDREKSRLEKLGRSANSETVLQEESALEDPRNALPNAEKNAVVAREALERAKRDGVSADDLEFKEAELAFAESRVSDIRQSISVREADLESLYVPEILTVRIGDVRRRIAASDKGEPYDGSGLLSERATLLEKAIGARQADAVRLGTERDAVSKDLERIGKEWDDRVVRIRNAGLFSVSGETFLEKKAEEEAPYLERLRELDAEAGRLAFLERRLEDIRKESGPAASSAPASEPIEPAREPAHEPVSEPAPEPVPDPVTEPTPEPVPETSDTPSPDPDADKKERHDRTETGKEPVPETSAEWKERDDKAKKAALKIFESYRVNNDSLLRIPGFNGLSGAQRLLIAENFRQVALERTEERSGKGMAATDAGREADMPALFRAVYRFMPKDVNMRMVDARKEAEAGMMSRGSAEYGAILETLTDQMRQAEFLPEVELDAEGRIEGVRFLAERKFAELRGGEIGTDGKDVLQTYNRSARALSKMPYEWSLREAKKIDHMRYRKAEEDFLAAKSALIGISGREETDPELVGVLARSERDLRLMQLFSSNPDVENALGAVTRAADRSKVLAFLKTNVFEKGAYMGFGYLRPMLAAGTLGFLTAPVVSAGLGALRSFGRARNVMRKDGASGRRGAERGDSREAFAREYGALSGKTDRTAKEEKRFRKLSVLFGDGFDGRFGREFDDLSRKRDEWKRKNGDVPWKGKHAERYDMLASWKKDEEEYVALETERKEWTARNGDTPWTGDDADRYRERSEDRRHGYGDSHPERQKEVVAAYAEIFGTDKTYIAAGDRASSDGKGPVKRGLSSKLERLTRAVADAKTDEERTEALDRLHVRVSYVRRKLDDGLIDFGSAERRTRDQAELVRTLADAEAVSAVLGGKTGSDLERRIGELLDLGDRKMSAGEKRFMTEQMRNGAIVSASFGFAGSLARHFQDVWQGESELLPGFFRGDHGSEVGTPNGQGEDFGADGELAVAEAPRPDEAVLPAGKEPVSTPEVPATFSVEARPGEGLTHLARHATDRYLETDPDSDLTAEQRVYIEDYLRREAEFSGTLHPGDSVGFSRDMIEDAIREAKGLDPDRLRNLSPYADRVTEFRDLPRSGTDLSENIVPEKVPAESVPETPAAASESVVRAYDTDAIRQPGIRNYVSSDPLVRETFIENVSTMRKEVFGDRDSATYGGKTAGDCFRRFGGGADDFAGMSKEDRSFGRFVFAAYGELYDTLGTFSGHERDVMLIPRSDETVDSYFERISFVLMKKGVKLEEVLDSATHGKDADVVQFLQEKGVAGGTADEADW